MAEGDGTFGGVTFQVLEAGALSRADSPVRTRTSERLSVGGSRRVRQFLGTESPELAFGIITYSRADMATLQGLARVGTIGTLTVDGGGGTITYTSYYLDRLENLDIDDTNDEGRCTAVWKGP